MKTRYLLIGAATIIMFYFGCAKNKSPQPVLKSKPTVLDTAFTQGTISASIVGKWLVNKQRMQILTTKTGDITDTTYTSAYFDNNGLYQFSSDSLATFTNKTVFFTSGGILVDGSTRTFIPLLFTFKIASPQLTIAYQRGISLPSDANPGPYPMTIVQLDNKNLVIHAVTSTPSGRVKTVMDISLTRQ